MIENDLNHMINWFSANKLSLNLSKMVAIKFQSNNEDRNFQLRIKGQIVPIVPNTKFLGVYIDNMLIWNAHTNYLIEKLQNNCRMLSLGKHLLDPTCLRNIYYGHIHSNLLYGLAAWSSMTSASQKKKLQYNCVCTFAKEGSDLEKAVLIKKSNILDLDSMIIYSCKE